MKLTMNPIKIFRRFQMDHYFSARLILAIDLITSVSSSAAVLLLSEVLTHAIPRRHFILLWLLGAALFSLGMFLLLRTYRSIIRYSTLSEVGRISLAAFGKEVCLGLFFYSGANGDSSQLPLAGLLLLDLPVTVCSLVMTRVVMIAIYDALKKQIKRQHSFRQVLIYGERDKSISLVMRLRNSSHYRICGFLVYGTRLKGHTLAGCPIYYFETENDLRYLSDRYDIDALVFAYYGDARHEQERLIKYGRKYGLKILIAPTINELADGKPMSSPMREIRIEDLLGRPEIHLSVDKIVTSFQGKTVLVTGAAGSIGSELCRQLAKLGVCELILFDNAETPLHTLRLEFEDTYPLLRFIPVIGDVRFPARLDFVFRRYRPQVVFHAAAYKHVPLMEENPCEAVYVNVVGSRHVADKCIEYGVEKMVMISTDKAVNPTNIMGCTKRLAEIYVQSLGLAVERGRIAGRTRFVTTRFGNVLGSSGSVIPRFREQIAKGGPVTVTHPEIRRFFMTIPEACRLVMEAATLSAGNQICVFDMGEPVKIARLAEQMIELSDLEVGKDIRIEYTGLRPGEKLYEEVLASKENTMPTSHDSIRIAQVREYDYEIACTVAAELERLSQEADIPAMVCLMKQTVPEFRSQHSEFEKYDGQYAPSNE